MLSAAEHQLGAGDGAQILDIATGPGEPATMLAQAFPSATVWATDMAPGMLDQAKERAAGLANVEFAELDMQNMSQFDDNQFELATACYAYMFPEDKAKALSETLRVLKPGGCLVATYWVNVRYMQFAGKIMETVLGEKPPPPPINPMSLAEPGLFDGLLSDAGFKVIEYEEDEYPFVFPGDDDDHMYKLGTLTMKAKLDEMDAHEVARKAFFEHLPDYSSTTPEGVLIGPNRFAHVVAQKPE